MNVPISKLWLAAILLGSLIVVSCSDDDDDTPTNPVPESSDYFPFGREYRWTYTSNFLAEHGHPSVTMEMKIDTAISNDQVFWFLRIRLPGIYPDWMNVIGLQEDGNVISSIGDHPPETPYPLFKHTYDASDGVAETITVQGVTYDAFRVDLSLDNDVTISWWFAPNIGLIKEYSEKGGSLFIDDHFGDDVIMNTELVSFEKIQ